MGSNKKVILVGAGIMSATLAMLLKQLDPSLRIKIVEMLDTIGAESSAAMNNAGTGHSGFCELNYTPEKPDGSVDIKKALEVASEFSLSKEFWAYLVKEDYLRNPKKFINQISHYSFVNNEKDAQFLKNRYEALKKYPLFENMEFSSDSNFIKSWIPLVMDGRDNNEVVAATKVSEGTDVNFENVTQQLIESLVDRTEIELLCGHAVKGLSKNKQTNKWDVEIQNIRSKNVFNEEADFIFIGAGGGSIFLLEKSGIPEAQMYGGFPVGGEWLVCDNPEVVKKHQAKVYGQAKIGAPPMSVPHLDTRIIDGEQKLLFGPFAIFSTKFLKNGSYLDLFKSLQVDNLGLMTQAGFRNLDLTKYLIQQVSLSKKAKIKELQEYLPSAEIDDWHEQIAGQRVQVIKKDKEKGGILQFGTEVVCDKKGTIAALLGASPGASTSVAIMVKLIERCFNKEFKSKEWQSKLKEILPSLFIDSTDRDSILIEKLKTNKILKLN